MILFAKLLPLTKKRPTAGLKQRRASHIKPDGAKTTVHWEPSPKLVFTVPHQTAGIDYCKQQNINNVLVTMSRL